MPIAEKIKKGLLKHPFISLVLVVYLLMTIFSLSGSSVGVFSNDSSKVITSERLGIPREIRSDEWLVNTSFTVAQYQAGYPRVNQNIGQGQDMSVALDVPYKEWSILFKPQNLFFFILPFSNAFAAKWWFSLVVMLLGTYGLSMSLLKNRKDRRLISSLLSIATSFNPMLIWWYQSATSPPLTIGYLMILATLYIKSLADNDNTPSVWQNIKTKSGALKILSSAYFATCWALLMYPPFQIAAALGFCFFLVGYTLNSLKEYSIRPLEKMELLLKKLTPLLIGGLITTIIVLIFIKTRFGVIEALQNTIYPGKRDVFSGGGSYLDLLSGSFDYALQIPSRAANLATLPSNQSEFSSFGPWWMFSLILMPILIFKKFKKGAVDWQAIFLVAGSTFVLSRIFISWGDILYSPTLLNVVPHKRLKFIFIILSFFTLITWVQNIPDKIRSQKKVPTFKEVKPTHILLPLTIFTTIVFAGLTVGEHVPGLLIRVKAETFIVASLVATVLFLALQKRVKPMLILITIFTIGSSLFINPLQRSLGKLEPSSKEFKVAQSKINTLITKDDLVIESTNIPGTFVNIAEFFDKDSLTGIYTYPDLELWEDSGVNTEIYNRYAHVTSIIDGLAPPDNLSLNLIASDHFSIEATACSLSGAKFNNRSVTKIISSTEISSDCVREVGDLNFLDLKLTIYQVLR